MIRTLKQKSSGGRIIEKEKTEQPKGGFLERGRNYLEKRTSKQKEAETGFRDFIGGELTGKTKKTGTLGSMVQSTYGSKGVLGMVQMPWKVSQQGGILNDKTKLLESQGMLSAITAELIVKRRSTTDPKMMVRLDERIKDNLKQIQDMNGSLAELESYEMTPGEALGTTGRTISTLMPLGFKGAEKSLNIPQLGGGASGAIKRVATRFTEGYLTGAGFGASGAAEEGKTIPEILKTANSYGMSSGAFSGLFQGAIEGINGFSNMIKTAGNKIQTSRIRPTTSQLEDIYVPKGKNPYQVYRENVDKYKLYGSADEVFTKGEQQLNELSEELYKKLPKDKAINVLNDVGDEVQEMINTNKENNLGVARSLQRIFDDSKEEFSFAYGDKIKNLDLIKANNLKRATGGLSSYEYGRVDPDAKSKEIVYGYWYKALKKAVEIASGNEKEVMMLNRQISELIPLRNAALSSIPGQMKATPIGLKEFIGGAAALADPHAAALLAINYLSKSGNFAEFLAGAGSAIGGKVINPAIQAGPAQGAIFNSLRERFR